MNRTEAFSPSMVRALAMIVGIASTSCNEEALAAAPGATIPAEQPPSEPADAEHDACRARIEAVLAEPELAGAPEFDRRRTEIFGRARGEPLVLVQAPRARVERLTPRSIRGTLARLGPRTQAARDALLADGYVYSDDPAEALALVEGLELRDLFEDESIWLERGGTLHELVRSKRGYEHADGASAHLLFGDRVARAKDELAEPQHRDLRELSERTGAERISIAHATSAALVANARFGDRRARILISTEGARAKLDCVDAPLAERRAIEAWHRAAEPRRAALFRLRASVASMVSEALPFDRAREAPDHLADGQLRPAWRWAYERGQFAFVHEERSYPVFDARGRPFPPQVCADFILDSFERASGAWYGARGEPRKRSAGSLDFRELGITNRQGVLQLAEQAEKRSDAFEVVRFENAPPFADRARFFAFLEESADQIAPGDIVAIRGVKSDGNVHQHAILVLSTDPVTGFASNLADQMRVPRERTWEQIMAEAPRRRLHYRLRLRPAVLARIAPGVRATEG